LSGVLNAVLAYGAWGLFPLYWKLFGSVPPVEIVCHRVVWSLVFMAGLAAALKRGPEIRTLIRKPKTLAALLLTATLLSLNWGIFIYAVSIGRIVETSLGYFIVPLVNVLMGYLVFKERLSRQQIVAVILAAAGVLVFGAHLGSVPWIALGLALSFGLYGLFRKMVPASPIVGVLAETALLTPVALLFLAFMNSHHQPSSFLNSDSLTLLFLGSGIVTSLPLLWFNNAAKLLPLSTMGFFQYLAPSLQLLVGVAVYHEPFPIHKLVAFVLIWSAIALFIRSAFRPAAALPLAD
jgi:chloramphenicol-sensitive protein RarD